MQKEIKEEEILKGEATQGEIKEKVSEETTDNKEEKKEHHHHEHGGHKCCGKHHHEHKHEDSEEEIGKLKAEIEEWKQSYLRKQADFQNFTKRKEKEVAELKEFASEKIITQFLGNLDNLERAIDSSVGSKDFDSLLKGVEMIVRGLKDLMTAEGVE